MPTVFKFGFACRARGFLEQPSSLRLHPAFIPRQPLKSSKPISPPHKAMAATNAIIRFAQLPVFEAALLICYLGCSLTALEPVFYDPALFNMVIVFILETFHVTVIPVADGIYLTVNFLSAAGADYHPLSPLACSFLRLSVQLFAHLRNVTLLIPTREGLLSEELLTLAQQAKFLDTELPGPALPPGVPGFMFRRIYEILRAFPNDTECWNTAWLMESPKLERKFKEHYASKVSDWVGVLIDNMNKPAIQTMVLQFQHNKDGLGRSIGADGMLVNDVREVIWARAGWVLPEADTVVHYL
ncbi:uncharacterized protein K452DRAFT_361657 [Aplosporella prunicola CBS 121167]|uniref:Uncharacterized protein n=1 Tax=Aplosporella prunicola CBS 121167 TaxID=1176127 RepID=A0A6A6B3H6_9PEZI|nr:uncharacterized protein K452DRAFT_361657 [Aplosporella prunicola CBS 121167]KAF2137923.1 hypothetical protein K452DRAFT_361657 [Aplosporella prunicola CBS 121167]